MSLINHTRRQIFAEGDIIIAQGSAAECAYLVEEGQVEIYVSTPDEPHKVLGQRGPGSIIGEMAIIDNKPRTANIRALTPCALMAISQRDLERRLGAADPVIRMLMHVILTRYRALLHYSQDPSEGVSQSGEEAENKTDISKRAFETIRLTHDFKEAILGYQLRLHYQPIIDLKTMKTIGFEALMRWHHPFKGIVLPSIFIPVAEDSGLIVHASRWALREGVYLLNRLSEEHGLKDPWFMSLNFTGLDLAAEDFADSVSEALQGTSIAPDRIKLEITERMLIDDPDGAIRTFKRCKAAGLSLALDDFGTGYSSLSYLNRFPIDTMKIDRSFVVNMVEDPSSLTLVKTVIALAKGLNMTIVAEGVETEKEHNMLLELGCDMAQGFLYGRPMPEPDLVLWLEETKKSGIL